MKHKVTFLPMNVTVEVDDTQMQGALKRAAQNISRVRPVPGFRPGKAPRDMVVKRYDKDIQEEVKRKLGQA